VGGRLLDTNHLGLAVRHHSKIVARIDSERRKGLRVGTCLPARCELQFGARYVAKPAEYQRSLTRLLKAVRLWPLTLTTTQHYGDIARDLRSRGRVFSQVDIILAALCREMDLTLVTTDKDFAALSWLKTEDWT